MQLKLTSKIIILQTLVVWRVSEAEEGCIMANLCHKGPAVLYVKIAQTNI